MLKAKIARKLRPPSYTGLSREPSLQELGVFSGRAESRSVSDCQTIADLLFHITITRDIANRRCPVSPQGDFAFEYVGEEV